MPNFMKLMKDNDLNVRRQAFLTINAIIHSNIQLVVDQLQPLILPTIYEATIIHPELIREVDLGPFKHKVDDGLPLRKTAFLCLDTLLDHGSEFIDFSLFIQYLLHGITDQDDIQLISYKILTRLAQWNGQKLLENLDKLPPVLMQGIKQKIKDAKGNEPDRANDIIRAATRAIFAINKIKGAEFVRSFQNFYNRVLKTPQLVYLLYELGNETIK